MIRKLIAIAWTAASPFWAIFIYNSWSSLTDASRMAGFVSFVGAVSVSVAIFMSLFGGVP